MNEKIIKRIENLLNKTVENGCTEQEALAATTMAQKLIAKHHVDVRELGSDVEEKVDSEENKVTREWEQLLAHIVSKNMCCRVVLSHDVHVDKRGNFKRKTTVVFIGKDTDRKAVVALFDKLTLICKENIKIQKRIYKEKYGTFKGVEDSYARGFIKAIKQVMGAQCKALMLIVPEEVDDKMNDLFPKIKPTKVKRKTLSKKLYDKGFSDGRDAMETKRLK